MKKQSKRKLAELMSQYPAVQTIHLETYAKSYTPSVFVERADTSFMYRRADNVVGNQQNGGHYRIRQNGEYGTCYEHAYVIGHDNQILKKLSWDLRESYYVRTVFHAVSPESVAYIIWVAAYDWYEAPGPGQYQHGSHTDGEVLYTIHLPPKEGGFEELFRTADVLHNVELTERSLIDGYLIEEASFIAACKRLNELAKTFERRVYLNGLKKVVDASKKKGMSGTLGGVKVMSWVMCGRVMVTMETPCPNNPSAKNSYTVTGNEDGDPRMSFRSIYATLDRATEIVEAVCSAWEGIPVDQRSANYGDDTGVKLAGM